MLAGSMLRMVRTDYIFTPKCRGFSTLHRRQTLSYTPASGLSSAAIRVAARYWRGMAVVLVRHCIDLRFVIALTVQRSTRVHYCT